MALKLRRAFVHGVEEEQLIDGRNVECVAQGNQDRLVCVKSFLRELASVVQAVARWTEGHEIRSGVAALIRYWVQMVKIKSEDGPTSRHGTAPPGLGQNGKPRVLWDLLPRFNQVRCPLCCLTDHE